MNETVKKELHQLIDNCDNVLLLAEVKDIFLSSDMKDWWDELTEEDKSLVMESETQYKQGEFISNKDLLEQFEEWKKK